MPTVYLAPDPINSTQLIPGGVVPAAGGKLFHYLAGTSTKTDVYVDNTGTTKWANPIVLDSGGNLGGSNEVWIPAGVTVKFVLAPFNDTDPPITPYKTWDNLSGINDATSILTEWIPGPAPTFVSATSFTLVGDQTAIFTANRRIKATVTSGTVYGYIRNSVFGVVTTITIDSAVLDSGLSAIWYGILNSQNTSVPQSFVRLEKSVTDYGAIGNYVIATSTGVDCTTSFAAAINAQTSNTSPVKLRIPAGNWLITSSLPNVIGGMTIEGDGARESVLVFNGAVSTACLTLSEGAATVGHTRVGKLGFYSPTTKFQVAIDSYDLTTCNFEEIYIHGIGGTSGPAAGLYWSGVGMRTHGRDSTGVKDAEIIADYPVYIAANPNASSFACEDMDHWHWENCYLLANAHYAITVADGLGIQNTTFDGYQAWVGGAGGFYMMDNRVSPTITSHNLTFKNVRGEQGTSSNGYWINITASTAAEPITISNFFGGSGTQGIKYSGSTHLLLDSVTMATAAGKNALLVDGSNSLSTIKMQNCIWQSGAVISTTGYVPSWIEAFNTDNFSGPANAVYVIQPTTNNLDVRYSMPSQNLVRRGAWQMSIANSSNVNIVSAIGAEGVTSGILRVVGSNGATIEGGTVLLSSTTVKILSSTAAFGSTNVAGLLSVFLDGGNNLTISNNRGVALNVIAVSDL